MTTAATTLTLANVTTSGTNRYLLVGVSINQQNSAATVSSVVFGASSASIIGFQTSNNRRVELWGLLNPPAATANVVITFSTLAAANTGVYAAALPLSSVNQTTPVGTAAGATATNAAPTVNVGSVAGDFVVNVLGFANNAGVTVTAEGAGQTLLWDGNSGGAINYDVRGHGSYEIATGATTTMSHTLSAGIRWEILGVAVKPARSDVSISKSASATTVAPGGAITYTLTVSNNGPDTATGVTLTDTLPAGMTYSLVTGTGCTGGATTTCSIGTLANGASSVVTLVATTTTAGTVTNTASVTANETDPTPGNNSSNAATTVQPCASPGSAGPGGTLSGIVNAYWPGTANAAAGATSVTVGARTGVASSLVANDLVLVIQMQDASINSANTTSYGDGTAGEPVSGSTALNSSGLYEFATVTSTGGGWTDAGGGTINLASTGTGGGLVNSYFNADATGTQGQRRFQVIRVPQYSTASLGSATALAWSTRTAAPIGLGTGGVLVIDVAGALDVTGTTSNVSGLGFRGGAGRQLTGGAGANTDVRTSSTVTTNASKAEGIAGNPAWIAGAAGPVATNQPNDGYPNGSYARGAPANAGGGSTDGRPAANDENSGGGGGGNGGSGARGGNSWNSNLPYGGSGGIGYGAAATRFLMGGGGGAGTRNNSPCDALAAGGAPGGGIVILRAGQITGTGTIQANGADAYNNTANDGGGGGGAGGTVVLIANTGDLGGVTVNAHGGRGGDAWARASCSGTLGTTLADRHGPGGGGGGGVVVSSFPVGTIDVAGGQSGVTTTLNDGFGTEPGAAGGTSSIVISNSVIPGVGGGVACSCDPAIALTHTPNGGSAGGNLASNASGYFTATVTNVAPYLSTSGTLTVTFTIPAGLTPVASAAGQTLGGTGWTGCTIVGQAVSCQRSDSVAPGVAYPPMIVPFTTGTGPTLLTTTAALTVSGGTNANYNLANDTASDSAVLLSPTLARMGSVKVVSGPGGTAVVWRTSFEVDNLGFRVWREDGGARTERTRELLAGSALFAGQNVTLSAGRQYRFVDAAPSAIDSSWWIEEVDLSGAVVWHGPFRAVAGDGKVSASPVSPYISLLAEKRPAGDANRGIGAERWQTPALIAATLATVSQGDLAAAPAAKIAVSREGWHRVTKAELLSAGFDPGSDPTRLRLFAEAAEQAFVVKDGGDGSFDPSDSIEFYGTGLDTPATDRRVYWLVGGAVPGLRANVAAAPSAGGAASGGFPFVSTYKERVVYVAALTSLSDHDNFFGPVAGPAGATISVPSPNRVPGAGGTLTVTLQGTTHQAHAVDVLVGAQRLGTISFSGQEAPRATFPVPSDLLSDVTAVTLKSLNGSMDYSVLDVLTLEYTHRYGADDDALGFSAAPGASVAVSGFTTSSVGVIDVSDSARPVVLTPVLSQGPDGWTATVEVPAAGGRRILAVAASRVRQPAAIEANAPSQLSSKQKGGAFVVIAHPSLVSAAAPLAAKRRSEGVETAIVDVTDVYDEFSFGEKDPAAVRAFLRVLWKKAWKPAPRYVLFLGDATFDPRNYLGLGSFDLVPTNFVPTQFLMTSSDDAFVDFEASARPEMAVGRLPARTAADATLMVGKALARGATAPNPSVLVASDVTGEFDFASAAGQLAGLVPATYTVQRLDGNAPPGGNMRAALIQALNAGPSQATWVGHGSEATLGIQTVFDGADALSLTNQKLPVFLAADCLNGYFQDVYGDSLAESLLKAPNGGAAAVWASSALTEPEPQMTMMNAFYAALYGGPAVPRLGDAVVKAKRATTDPDVSRSWILFGDPTMAGR